MTFVATLAATFVVPGFRYDDPLNLAVFAVVLTVANAVVRPILLLLTCPIQLATLGLAYFLVNAVLFLALANLVPGVRVDGFLTAFLAALVVSLVSTVLNMVVKS